MRTKGAVRPQAGVGVVLIVVVIEIDEATEIPWIDDRSLTDVAWCKVLVDVEAVDIRARSYNRVDTLGEIVSRRDAADHSVTSVLEWIVILEPERIVVITVVPVVLAIRRAVVHGAALLPVS